MIKEKLYSLLNSIDDSDAEEEAPAEDDAKETEDDDLEKADDDDLDDETEEDIEE